MFNMIPMTIDEAMAACFTLAFSVVLVMGIGYLIKDLPILNRKKCAHFISHYPIVNGNTLFISPDNWHNVFKLEVREGDILIMRGSVRFVIWRACNSVNCSVVDWEMMKGNESHNGCIYCRGE